MFSPRVISEGMRKREFDFGTFGERGVGEKKDSARTQILGEAQPFNRLSGWRRETEEDKETAVRHGVQLQPEEWS